MQDKFHYSVMLKDVISGMNIDKDSVYIDCTFGQGGYSQAFLEKGAYVIALDQDESALLFAQELLEKYKDRFQFFIENFIHLDIIDNNLLNKVDGIVFDLGLSHTQIQDQDRGFSFNSKNSLDMTMSKKYGKSVESFINTASEKEIADVLYQNANEYYSRKIASKIVEHRKMSVINTGYDLAQIISSIIYRKGKLHPATKTFQALRIWANDELNSLKKGLLQALKFLKEDGVLCVVSFHSEEDRIVKHFIRDNMIRINKKVIKPSREEVLENVSSRSAVMRLAKKKVLYV